MAYAYELKYLNDTIDFFLIGYTEDDLSIPSIAGKPYYAYMVTSDMTAIDVAFISSDMSCIFDLANYGYNTPAVMIITGAEEDISDDEQEAYVQQLHNQGIDIVCDEDGSLYEIGDALMLDEPLSKIVNSIDLVNDLGIDPALIDTDYINESHIIKNYILETYKDSIYSDLYSNSADGRPIFILKHDHWRF